MVYLLFAAGLVALVFGGEFLVRGAVGVAKRFGVPPLVIGLTVVGFGTSAPELMVSLRAALAGTPGIAVGNVVGSNIANVLLILGVAALIFPVVMRLGHLVRDLSFMVGATVVLWALMWNGVLGRAEGIVLLGGLATYIAICLRDKADPLPDGELPPNLAVAALYTLGGLAVLLVGARLLVDSATVIARDFGVSEAVIGLTIVAVGTSLPELAASVVAAFRKHSEIAVGNVIGSNIFNALGILGVTAIVTPVPVEPRFITFDMWFALGAALVLVGLAALGRIGRTAGAALLAAYAGYVALMGAG